MTQQNTDVPNEGQHSDCKSLRKVTGRTANFAELAQDCVCFANGSGGQLRRCRAPRCPPWRHPLDL